MKKLLLLTFFYNLIAVTEAQTLQSVTPNSGQRGAVQLPLVIAGSNTSFQQASSTTIFLTRGNTTLIGYNLNILNNQRLMADIDIPNSATLGLYHLYVLDGNNYPVLQNAFSVTQGAAPVVIITPDTVCGGQLLPLLIAGQNTHFYQGSSTFYLESTGGNTVWSNAQNVSSDSSAIAYFDFNGVAPGNYELVTYDYFDDTVLSADQLYVHGPELLSVDTDQSIRGVTLNVTLNGLCTNFQSASSTSVWFQQNSTTVNANFVTVSNMLQLFVNITLSSNIPLGYYDVYVSDPIDNQFSKSQGFLVIDTPLGIQSIKPEDLKVFPNPASGSLFVETGEIAPAILSLIDLNGKIVYSKNHASSTEELPLGNLPSGIYILSVTDKTGNSIYKKVAIQ